MNLPPPLTLPILLGYLVTGLEVFGMVVCAGLLVLGFWPRKRSHNLWGEAWRRLQKNRSAMAGYFTIMLLGFVAFGADFLSPHDYQRINLDREKVCVLFEGPSTRKVTLPDGRTREEFVHGHYLGTDLKGRDNLSRLMHGARISLEVGLISQVVAGFLGILIGLISGYYGGWIDMLLMRLTDVMLAFPFLLFVMTIVAVIGNPPIHVVFFVIGLVGWPHLARLVRAQVMVLKEREFIEAARSLGAHDGSILFKHLLPNCMAPIIVQISLGLAGAILSEAGLSFLGFGAQPPLASWGLMVAQGQEAIDPRWWVSIYPGLAIMVSVFAFNLLGDGLRDALDPRLR
jgi:ABC-type dipeptide/oligopeptide/nickel transport system permease subunit